MERVIVVKGYQGNTSKQIDELSKYLSKGWTVKFAVPFNDGEDVFVIIQEPV